VFTANNCAVDFKGIHKREDVSEGGGPKSTFFYFLSLMQGRGKKVFLSPVKWKKKGKGLPENVQNNNQTETGTTKNSILKKGYPAGVGGELGDQGNID